MIDKKVIIFEEYIIVVQGQYDLFIGEDVISLLTGDEYVILGETVHSGEVFAGTRAIYAFGGHRAERKPLEENK